MTLNTCRRCGGTMNEHRVFHDEPTAEQAAGLVEADFGVAMSGLYCPVRSARTVRDRVERLLADLYGVRIIDVTGDDVDYFLKEIDRHGFLLVTNEGIVR